MRKTNFTLERNTQISNKLRFLAVSLLFMAFGFNNLNAQCALACNSHTQVSLDQNCEAEVTADMLLSRCAGCPHTQDLPPSVIRGGA